MSSDSGSYPDGYESQMDEIDEMVSMAEASAQRVRSLRDSILKSNVQLMTAVSVAYLVMGATVFSMYKLNHETLGVFFQAGLLILTTVLSAASLLYAYMKMRLRSQIRQDIKLEMRMMAELIAIASSLMKGPGFNPSPVRAALLEMRLRRLHYSGEQTI